MARDQRQFDSLLKTIEGFKNSHPVSSKNLKIKAGAYGPNKDDVEYLIATIRRAGIASNIDLLDVGDEKLLEGLDLSDFTNLAQKNNDWVDVAAAEVNSDHTAPPRCTII